MWVSLVNCSVIFFFNFHQINRALVNPVMSKNMDALFGKEYALELKSEINNRKENLNSVERELLVLEGMEKALKNIISNLQPMLKFKFLKFWNALFQQQRLILLARCLVAHADWQFACQELS